MTIRFHKNDLPDLRALRCRCGRHRHRDARAQSASRPALRRADFAGRRHRRRHPDRAGPARGAQSRQRCSATRRSPRSSTIGRFDIAVLYHAFGVMAEPVFCTKIASRLTRTYTDRHGLKDICCGAARRQPVQGAAVVRLGGRDADAGAARICGLRRAPSAPAARGAVSTAGAGEPRREMPTPASASCRRRARLDLMGWAEEDIFAHS